MHVRSFVASFIVCAFAVSARAQYPEPVLLFLGDPGRPDSGLINATSSALGDDLFLAPVVVVPKLNDNGVFPYVIIEVPGGDPIVLPLTPFPGLIGPGHASSGDLAGDGSDDFVVANGEGSVSVFTGQTGPVLSDAINTPISGAQSPFRIAAMDIDGVGRDDIAVGDAAGVRLLLNQGNGQFGDTSVMLPMPSLRDIAVGDVNGDGHDDLVIVSGSGSSGLVQVWRRDFTSPQGFTLADTIQPGMAVASAELVDLNANGTTDLVLALHELSSGSTQKAYIKIWLNPGNGDFPTAPAASMQRVSSTGTLPCFAAVGDLDDDTDIDLVYTENDSIAYPPGTFAQFNPPACLVYVQNNLAQGQNTFTLVVRATRFVGKAVDPVVVDFPAGPPPGLQASSSLAGGDSDLDIAFTWRSDQAAGTSSPDEDDPGTYIAGFVNDNEAQFPTEPKPVQFPTGNRPSDGAAGEVGDISGPGSIEPGPGDNNPNGPDVVVPNMLSNSLTVALGDGGGHFPEVSQIHNIATLLPVNYKGGPRTALLDKMDGDAWDDCVTYSEGRGGTDWASQLTQLVSDGTSELIKVQEILLDHAGEAALGDIDGDGLVDAVVTRRRGTLAPQDIEIHFGDGSGLLDQAVSPVAIAARNSVTLCGGIDIADVDHDGDLDVASTYCRPAKVQQPGGFSSVLVQAGVILFRNDWTSTSTLVPLFSVFATATSPPDVESVALGQIGGSSVPDVVVGHRAGAMWHGRGLGTGYFTPQVIDSESATVGGGSLALADTDENGLLDVVSHKGEIAKQAVVQVHHSNGSLDFQVREIGGWCPADADGGTRPMLADFNLNGEVDLCIAHPNDTVTLLLNDGFGLAETGGGSGPNVPTLRVGGVPTAGGTLRLRVAAAAGSLGSVLAGPAPPPGAPLSGVGLLALLPFRTDADGQAELWLQLPAAFDPPLDLLALQALVPGAGASSVLTLPLVED